MRRRRRLCAGFDLGGHDGVVLAASGQRTLKHKDKRLATARRLFWSRRSAKLLYGALRPREACTGQAQARLAVQCPEAPAAPKPVSERTCCAGNAARSRAALALLSVIENSQMPTKPMVMENSAGEV